MADPNEAMRSWLADILRDGSVPEWPGPDGQEAIAVALAKKECVVALVNQRLNEPSLAAKCSPALRAGFASAARIEAARSLAQLSEGRRVVELLAGAGFTTVLLKGSALALWLYPSAYLRECGDIDLLLSSREEVERALQVLLAAGYVCPVRSIAGNLVSYELMCVDGCPDAPGFEIDLHWMLCNTPLFAGSLGWEELRASVIALPALGDSALGLGRVHAMLHACLHRANTLQHGDGDQLRWLYDLKLLAGRLDALEWERLLELARERGMAGACAHGLLSAQRTLDARVPPGILTALVDAASHEALDVDRMRGWIYAQWMTAKSLPDWRQRLSWLRQRILPDTDYLRDISRGDDRAIAVILWRRLTLAVRRIRRNP